MCFGGNKKIETQQTSSTDINAAFKPYYEDLAKRAKEASFQVSNLPYTGRFNAPANPLEFQGIDIIRNAVTGALPASNAAAGGAITNAAQYGGAGSAAYDLGIRTLGGEFTNPDNPIIQNAITAATRPIQESLDRNLVRTGATAAAQGAYGSSRVDQIKQDLINSAARESGDVGSRIVNDFVARERAFQNAAPQLIGQAGALEGLPTSIINQAVGGQTALGTTLGQAGEVGRSLEGLDIQNALLQFQEQQAAPNRALFPYAQLLGAIPTTTTTTQTGVQSGGGPSAATQGLQTALGLASMVAPFFLSDKRAKTDIKKIGKTDSGLPVYTYKYKTGGPTQMGVMAQDVEKEIPEAVISLGGVKLVDYGAL